MSTIGVNGIPPKMSIGQSIKILAQRIGGNFDPLNFGPSLKYEYKILYIQLPAHIDPIQCIMEINRTRFGSLKLSAFLPKEVPHLNLSKKTMSVLKDAKKHNVKDTKKQHRKPETTIKLTRNGIMFEMVSIYSGLSDVNTWTGNKLYGVLAVKIEERLADIWSKGSSNSIMSRSKSYRKRYPHDTDVAFIEECLQLAGGIGKPFKEDMLKAYHLDNTNTIESVPVKKVNAALPKYSKLITNKIMSHISALNTSTDPSKQTVEEAARIEVRACLQKMLPHIPAMVNETIHHHFVPSKHVASKGVLLRIFGEPMLPWLSLKNGILKNYAGQDHFPNYYNCLQVQVPRDKSAELLAANGTVVDGCKLIIRVFSPDMLKNLIKEINVSMSGDSTAEQRSGGEWGEERGGDGDGEPMEEEFENEESWGTWDEM